MEEGKLFYSRKYIIYRYKENVSFLPNVLAIGAIDHFLGSISDF